MKNRVPRIAFHAALAVAFVVGFLQYGFQIEPALANNGRAVQAGDVFVQDAHGNWVPKRSASKPLTRSGPRSYPITSRPVGPRPTMIPTSSIGASPLTASAFARMHNMTWKDHGTYGVMQDGASRIRLYPNSRHAVVMNRTAQLREPVARRNGALVLPACVVRHLSASASAERQRQMQLHTQRTITTSRPILVAPRTPTPAARPAPVYRTEPIYKPISMRAPLPPLAKTTPKPRVCSAHGSPGWAPSGVSERDWKWIILHHSDDTSGNAAKYDRVHRYDNGWEHGLGYHFVIGNGSQSGDGEVEIGPRWTKQLHGAHAKTPDNRFNDFGVGVCLVGNFDVGTGRPTAKQMSEMVRLLRWLQERYDIPAANIQGHCDCCPTACPGKNFPWAELRAQLR